MGWPYLGVRSWRAVLTPVPDECRYDADSDDAFLEAHESRRIHELRGTFLAQVAEVEDLLLTLLGVLVEKRIDVLQPMSKTPERLRVAPSGKCIEVLGKLSDNLGLTDDLQAAFGHLRWLLSRRNQLVHATVRVGFSQRHPDAPREAVVAWLQESRGRKPIVDWTLAPRLPEARHPGDGPLIAPDDIGESELEDDIQRAHRALDSALLIVIRLCANVGVNIP